MGLCLTRNDGEMILIFTASGEEIKIKALGPARLDIEAEASTKIYRKEIFDQIKNEGHGLRRVQKNG